MTVKAKEEYRRFYGYWMYCPVILDEDEKNTTGKLIDAVSFLGDFCQTTVSLIDARAIFILDIGKNENSCRQDGMMCGLCPIHDQFSSN